MLVLNFPKSFFPGTAGIDGRFFGHTTCFNQSGHKTKAGAIMNENPEENDKIAGRIQNHSPFSPDENRAFVSHDKIDNLIQFSRLRSPLWGGSIRELINKSMDLFETRPKKP